MGDIMSTTYLQAFLLFSKWKYFIEIRFLNTPFHTVSGIFTANPRGAEAYAKEVERLHLQNHTAYQVLNVLSENYLAGKQINRLIPYSKSTAKDADIQQIALIMTDFDPVRPSKTSSTDEEKALAYQRLLYFLSDMKQEGLMPYFITDSGNGYNAYFYVDLPNQPENVKLLKDFNLICHYKYSDDLVDFDRSVTNPARLAKLPGTWAVKGENTPERPHRQSKILLYRNHLVVTQKSAVRAYVEKNRLLLQSQHTAVKSAAGIQHSGTSGSARGKVAVLPDAEGYINSYGWKYWEKLADKGTMYVLPTCPFNPAHDNAAAFILAFPDGKAMFKCHHNGCSGNDIHKLLKIYPDTQAKE